MISDLEIHKLAFEKAQDIIKNLESKVTKLEEYATHKGHCDIVFLNMIDLKCTCGFDDV